MDLTDERGTEVPPAEHTEQRVIWAELFFDLIWVFAITQITASIAGATMPWPTLILLVPLWWGWVGTTIMSNAAGARLDGFRGRIGLFALAGCGLGMAVAVPHAYESLGWVYAGFYLVLRLGLWLAVGHIAGGRQKLNPFVVSLFVNGPLFVAGALLPGGWRIAVWSVAVGLELLSPVVLRRRISGWRFETEHLPERFGLFVIIALGETVVAVGASARGTGSDALTLPVAFLVIVTLWWTYFHFGASAARHAIRSSADQLRIAQQVFTYAHLLYVIAIIFVAVGLKKTVAHPYELPHKAAELLLAPGIALYLAGFCYSRWRMFGGIGLTRLAGAVAAAGLACAAPFLPLVVTAGLGGALLLGLNAYEAWRVETGRPLLLVGRDRVRG
ncbi:low temperature requirement protein A [Longispora albida]|uniref:low temperature requirement protein A n=1 Tax=Longispora albida TaxID=203523 RepID=UPI00036D161F|nr:low temperature requirement protein A [Longispora albida]